MLRVSGFIRPFPRVPLFGGWVAGWSGGRACWWVPPLSPFFLGVVPFPCVVVVGSWSGARYQALKVLLQYRKI